MMCVRASFASVFSTKSHLPNQFIMKVIIVTLALVALAAAAPVDVKEPKILRSEFDQQPNGAYNYLFETENGISRSETGEIKEIRDEKNEPHQVVVVRGSFTYTDNEGKVETINYVADENGYVAIGDSIPKPVSRR